MITLSFNFQEEFSAKHLALTLLTVVGCKFMSQQLTVKIRALVNGEVCSGN